MTYMRTFVVSTGYVKQVAKHPDRPPTKNGLTLAQTPIYGGGIWTVGLP